MDKMVSVEAIKGILLDKDGTLFDFHQTWVPILQGGALLAARGDQRLVPVLMDACGYSVASGRAVAGGVLAAGDTPELAALWATIAPDWQTGDLIQMLDQYFTAEGPLRAVPVTDLPALFGRLRHSGFTLGLATNDSHASAEATLANFGLADLFAFCCGYDSGHGSKPAPGMMHAFCAQVGLEPRDVAMVGDNFHDLEMARRAGAGLKIGVLTGTSLHADLAPHADIVLDSIADLLALLAAGSPS